jgi:hypothetical protein
MAPILVVVGAMMRLGMGASSPFGWLGVSPAHFLLRSCGTAFLAAVIGFDGRRVVEVVGRGRSWGRRPDWQGGLGDMLGLIGYMWD